MSFDLIQFQPIGHGEHRQGWPVVNAQLHKRAAERSHLLVDDFVDATWTYGQGRKAHCRAFKPAWAGIFHHPVEVRSPLQLDQKYAINNMLRDPGFLGACKTLRGCVAMCRATASELVRFLKKPVLLIKHPCDDDGLPVWSESAFWDDPVILQLGFFLRDTRFVEKLDIDSRRAKRVRVAPWLNWQKYRDQQLKTLHFNLERQPEKVSVVPRYDDLGYDQQLSRSVVVMHAYGTAANNVVVECIARRTPLVLNRTQGAAWYLGDTYPLFYESTNYAQAAELCLDANRLLAAHRIMSNMQRDWLSSDRFADDCAQFFEDLSLGRHLNDARVIVSARSQQPAGV